MMDKQALCQFDTVLLTGGSGFVGHWVARSLPASLHLRLLARPTSDLALLDEAGVAYERVEGDLLEPESLRRALRGADAVIHAAGLISFDRRAAGAVWDNNVRATAALFEAALEAGVSRVVQTASIFALGHAERGVVTGEEPFNGAHLLDIPYLRAKWEVERLSQGMIARGLPLVRLYPGLCLGPEDRTRSSSGTIAEWLRGRLPALMRGGICFVDVRDAARAHVAALACGGVGERYLLPGYNLSHRELFERLAPLAGRRAPRLTVPAWVGVRGASLLERLMDEPPLRRDVARLMGHRWWFRDDSAKLGIRYRPLEQTLRATLDGLR